MKARIPLVAALVLSASVLIAPAASADSPPGSASAHVDTISSVHPTTTATVRPNSTYALTGTYHLDWHLEQGDEAVPDSGGAVDGVLAGGAAPVPVDGASLGDGTYTFVGTISVDSPVYGAIPAKPFTTTFLVDRTPPAITSITPSAPVLYPRLTSNGRETPGYPSRVTFTIAGTGAAYGQMYRSGAPLFVPQSVSYDSGVVTWSWSAGNASYPATAGRYTFVVSDEAGNSSPVTATVDVSGLHWVVKKWTRTVTARASMEASFVGSCSTLKRPSSHRWAGSLGLYSNTKCKKRTWKASGVQTLHAIRIPDGIPLTGAVFVHTYGGAPKSKPKGTALIRVMTNKGDLPGGQRTRPKVGWNVTRVRAASSVVWSDRYVVWTAALYLGERYDLGKFQLEVTYQALG